MQLPAAASHPDAAVRTAGGGERGAALRRHPQVGRPRVKHHVEHLGRGANADFSKVLSLVTVGGKK